MPNWVYNTLTVDKDFERVRDYCKSDESPLDFDKIRPCPFDPSIPLISGSHEDESGENWYNWRLDNWGTKWNARDIEVKDNGFIFETPWDPPWGIISELMRQFPDVTFSLGAEDECCNGYWEVVAKDAKIISGSQDKRDPCIRCRDENVGCFQEYPGIPVSTSDADQEMAQ